MSRMRVPHVLCWVATAFCASCGPNGSIRSGDVRQADKAERHTRIVLLGTGTPNADPDRSGPAVAIVVGGQSYLVDCGSGVVRRAAAAARQSGIKALAAPNLSRVFITHLHSDHTLGLADLIFTPWVLGREVPLEIYGPKGIRAMADHIVEAYRQDIAVRTGGLEPANEQGYKVSVHEIEAGTVYQDENVTVKALPVRHGSWPRAFGFRFETTDRTIVISGDTAPCSSLLAGAEGCESDPDGHEILCAPEALNEVREALEASLGEPAEARLIWKPQNTLALDEDKARSLFKLLEVLDDHDDVQNVYANFEIDDAIMEKLSA